MAVLGVAVLGTAVLQPGTKVVQIMYKGGTKVVQSRYKGVAVLQSLTAQLPQPTVCVPHDTAIQRSATWAWPLWAMAWVSHQTQ